MKRIIGIGPREQDFAYTGDFFSGTITLYGSGSGNNLSYCASNYVRINHNVHSCEQADFIDSMAMKRISEDPDTLFMSYDPNQAFNSCKEIIERTVCLNEKSLMDKLNDKISFRRLAAPLCETHVSQLLSGSQCDYGALCRMFSGYDTFVIQSNCSSGGEGTFILNEADKEIIKNVIHPDDIYMVSGYEKNNIPINIHAVIYRNEILIFPVSIQIMRLNGCKLLYQGADYIAAQSISPHLLEDFRNSALKICTQLQREGYRGVTGIDAMIVGGSVRILEMNNRFQGSTILLNKALNDLGLPSMPELNYEAFVNDRASCSINKLAVPYSCFTYLADGNGARPRAHYRDFRKCKNIVDIIDEGLDYNYRIAPFATLERVIFNTNIVSVTEENTIRIHPNVTELSDEWVYQIVNKKNLLYLKIALINQGVCIPPGTDVFFKSHGGICEAVYNAVDIYLDEIVINSPVNVKLSDFSPFEIRVENGLLKLYFINEFIADINIRPEDTVRSKKTSSGQPVKDICLLATDRVRVQHSRNCCFKKEGVGCKFCEVENHEFAFEFTDICESIDMYINSDYKFRHFLIGGRSDFPDKEPDEIIRIAGYTNKERAYPIYVMCVPPASEEILNDFFDAGVTEIAFNIEIWDRRIARQWMPGKGAIPLEKYLDMLKKAVSLWGSSGAVRTAFVVGLEPLDSLLEGIRTVCGLGVAPILSVFRPIPGTAAEDLIPLSDEELLALFYQAREICHKYGLELGPQCVPCQNNTLSLPSRLICKESQF